MSDEPSPHDEDEREWQAERRDFVADVRDDVADTREQTADDREILADERDRQADEREAALDAREDVLDKRAGQAGHTTADQESRAEDRAARRTEVDRRLEEQSARSEHATGRTDAAKRLEATRTEREAAQPATRLARLFADLASDLFAEETLDDVLARVLQTALTTLDGCAMASITVRSEDGTLTTTASTDPVADTVDGMQYESGEGPCIDALDQAVVYAPSYPDERWPTLGDRPIQQGVLSTLSYSLTHRQTDGSLGGSLNSYGLDGDAFDDHAQEVGLILAAHSALAAHVVRERQQFKSTGEEFQEALFSRDVIGQAKGILMERMHLSAEEAFDRLRRASQQLNRKLRDIAERLAYTGELDGTRDGPQEMRPSGR